MSISISGKLAEMTMQNSMTQRERQSQWRKFHRTVIVGKYMICTMWIPEFVSTTGVQPCHRYSVQNIRWSGRVILSSDQIFQHPCQSKLTLRESKILMLVCVIKRSCNERTFICKIRVSVKARFEHYLRWRGGIHGTVVAHWTAG